MTPDHINACFESFGAIALCISIKKLYKDKAVLGFSYWPLIFYMSWGVFNIFYYSQIQQPYSWFAGIFVLLANTIYFSMVMYYTHFHKRNIQ